MQKYNNYSTNNFRIDSYTILRGFKINPVGEHSSANTCPI
jgi:hypothetical protein